MESRSVHNFLKGKCILLTGATGFLSKIFVEKILRVQPDVKRLYLLLRASNPSVATQRLHNEVFGKDLFRVLRDKWGAHFCSFISQKVVAVAGDVSIENLGIKDVNLRKEILEETDIIVHTAATTKLDERFDIAMHTNTMGAYHVLNFAKNCRKLEILLHVSTAYVSGEAKGIIPEEPFQMGQTLKGSSRLDIDLEKHLMEEKLYELQAQNAKEETVSLEMKNLGMKRANFHGWPNAYVFTKAMGEMLLANMKHNLHVIIIRPTMVISTYSKPFPGWIEGVRTPDLVAFKYATGTITSFIGHPKTIIDAIPADMVVNSMIMAIVAHSYSFCNSMIYHIGSSLRNPFKLFDFQDVTYSYFTKNPWMDKHGKQVAITKKLIILSSMDEIRRYQGLNLVGDGNQKTQMEIRNYLELCRPYGLFEGIFDDKNAESLRMAIKEFVDMDDEFNFDPMRIYWFGYMMNVHLPNLVKYSARSKM